MLVTPEGNRRNQTAALAIVASMAAVLIVAGWFWPPAWLGLAGCPVLYWLLRRRCLSRLAVMGQPFPPAWEQILKDHVAYFTALDEPQKERFRQLVKVFLSEVAITGVRTDIDDTVRILVAASAAIPIFGFHDWDYRRLQEVLVYPSSFSEGYRTEGGPDENTLGMVGTQHLSGTMILSKPDLLAGFDNRASGQHVGVHEFTHLVEAEEAERGLPPEVPVAAAEQWVRYVAGELSHPSANRAYINDYAYTNEHEFFAVLAEYFFKSPNVLRDRDPKLYEMLRDMFHQDPSRLLGRGSGRRSKGRTGTAH